MAFQPKKIADLLFRTIFVTTLGFSVGNQISAQEIVPKSQLEPITDVQALDRSEGQILLHFGSDFPENTKNGIIKALAYERYKFHAATGGPKGSMNLYIDRQKGKKSFTPDEAVTYLLSVLEKSGSKYKKPIEQN